jgi:hypothetical protein
MKPWAFLTAIAYALIAGGCADPLEQRTGQEVGSQLQRGISGQGHLTPESPSNQAGPSVTETPPEYPPPR